MSKTLKNFMGGLLVAATLAIAAPASVRAASWNDAFGMGNPSDDWLISGSGALLSVIPSVQSNSLYYVTSADSSGLARLSAILLRNDSIAGTLNFYVATNSWICTSNQPAGTNQIWLSTTNAGLATNDLLVLENELTDSYQLIVLSGNATDSAGLVATNALGECLIKVFNTPSNAIASGDKIWKLARLQTFTPLAMGLMTNQITAVPGDHFGQWLKFPGKEASFSFNSRLGVPSALVMTFSNTAALQVYGDYYARPRR